MNLLNSFVPVQIRTLNNLADRAGLTATEALAAVERAITEARKNGLEPVFGIEAASQSFAFVAATNKEAMKSWRAEKKK
jgi:hypothetical protein